MWLGIPSPDQGDLPMFESGSMAKRIWVSSAMWVVFLAAGHCLTISEIMYHPMALPGDDAMGGEALEYLELYNPGPETEDLTGYAIGGGVSFAFPEGTLLGPEQCLLIAKSPDALNTFYQFLGVDFGDAAVFGPWLGSLANNGEVLEVYVEGGGRLLQMEYDDRRPWPVAADGTGHSLELLNPFADLNAPENWDISDLIGGTPGVPGGFSLPSAPGPSPSMEAWTELGFDDRDWFLGPMPLGMDSTGPYPIATELGDMLFLYTTVYIRLPFSISTQDGWSGLELGVFYDDAFIAYLNGQEVMRSSTVRDGPGIAVPHNGTSLNLLPELADYAEFDLTEHMDKLRIGENVLSIQGVNSVISSNDFILAARLRGTRADGSEELVPAGANAAYFKGIREPTDDGTVSANHRMGRKKWPEVVINELMSAATAGTSGDWLELYNRGTRSVEIGGLWISDDRDQLVEGTAFQIPFGTVLEPGAYIHFDREQLQFGLSSLGERVFLTSADGSRVLDAVRFDEQILLDHSFGRYPDGAEEWVTMSEPSPGGAAVFSFEGGVIIHEIMYHPISDLPEDEYLELYNRTDAAIDLSGWSFSKGISFEFPLGTLIPPGDWLVVAKDPAWIAARYGIGNVIGPFSGQLSNSGEWIRLVDGLGNRVDEVRYYDGGDWPKAADGGGSSLERIDPRDPATSAPAWAASDESTKSEWIAFSHTATLTRWWEAFENELHLLVTGRAEMLLDELSMRLGSAEILPNGSFEDSANGWKIEGTLIDSYVTAAESTDGGHALRLVSSGRGDTACNRMEAETARALKHGATYTISGKARWLSGDPILMVRTHAQGIAFTVDLPVPERLGTPGAGNSAWRANRGPTITDVMHWPAVPSPGEPVLVTARVEDVDDLDSVQLLYRLDGVEQTFRAPVRMGPTGDPAAGIFTGYIRGQAKNRLVAFRVVAVDGAGETASYPPEGAGWDCLYWVGDPQASQFGRYRLLLPQATTQELQARPAMSNHLLPCAFVHNDYEVYYNCGFRLRGSPFTRGQVNPASSKRAMRIRFPAEKSFLDRGEINLDTMEPGRNPTLQSERVAYWIARKSGVPWSNTQFARVQVNQSDHGLYGDIQKVDSDFLSFWFPGDDDGYLYKIDDWFEFYDSGNRVNRNADLWLWNNGNLGGWGELKELYRWNYRPRSRETEDEFQPIVDLVSAANAPANEYITRMSAIMDIDEVLAEFAMQHIVGNWDTWGYNRGKNALIYQRPSDGRFVAIPWDIDFVMGSGASAQESLTNTALFGFAQIYSTFGDRYEMICRAMARDVLGSEDLNAYIDRTYALLQAEGIGATDPAPVKQFLLDRRTFILGPPMVITTNAGRDLITHEREVTILGTSPYGTTRFEVNGEPVEATWLTSTSWSITLELAYGENALHFEAFDSADIPTGAVDFNVTVQPFIMHQPEAGDFGMTITWNTQPERRYTLWAMGEDRIPVAIAKDLRASGSTTSYIDWDATAHPMRLYWAERQPLEWIPGLIARYYSGIYQSLLLERIEQQVANYWDSSAPAPGVPADQFSIRWTGYVRVLYPGDYTFWTNSDDGVRLSVNGVRVIDNWTDHGPTWDQGMLRLSAGYIPLELEYYERGGGATIELQFEGPQTPRQVISSGRLFHRPEP